MRFEYHNEPFLPVISAVTSQDSAAAKAVAAAWKKVEKKVVMPYAKSRGISAEHIRLIDLCGTDGELHPKLRAFVEELPRGERQSAEREIQYKREMCAHLQRAIDVAIAHLRDPGVDSKTTTNVDVEITRDEADEHPILAEIYKTLPRETVFVARKGPIQTETVTENGRLFYLSCAEALKTSDATTAQEFLLQTRLITKAIEQVCPVEKLESLNTILGRSRKQLGVILPKSHTRLRSDDWPSPLREQFKKLQAVVKNPVSGEIRKGAAAARVKLRNRIAQATVDSAEKDIGRLLAECWSEGPLSVQDMMRTSKSEEISADGNPRPVYHNPFLTPFREREKVRQSKAKATGFDSCTFKSTVTHLKMLAAYNGIFEYHQIIREAFKPHIDIDTRDERKAVKKGLIDRHKLDEWIEHNWPKYERILKGKTFARDKSKRSIREADKNMRFVLFYLMLVVMKVMGYRQRQMRDCRYGINLRITQDSFTFTYMNEQTKNGKPLSFTANMGTSGRTHKKLYRTLSLFYQRAYPYVQKNLAPRHNDDDTDPSEQFFSYLNRQGRFRRFHPSKNYAFNNWFRNACRSFLSGPELSKEAIMLLHPHYVRGASMDTFILDQGGSMEAASKYYGDTVVVIDRAYRDRHAVQDASRDVILVNAGLKQLEMLEASARERGKGEGKDASQSSLAEMSALLETNGILIKQLTAALERIGQLESKLSQYQ